MGKKVLSLFMFLTVICVGAVQAAPIQRVSGNTAELWGNDDFSFGVGVQYDSLDERELEGNSEIGFDAVSGLLALDFMKQYRLYGTLGQTSNGLITEKVAGTKIDYDVEDDLIWSVGLAADLYTIEDQELTFFGDISYRSLSESTIENLKVNGSTISLAGLGVEADYEEFQVALGLSKKFEKFTPYAGVQYSNIDYVARVGSSYEAVGDAADEFGVFVGSSIEAFKGVDIDVQGRFVNETAFTVGATYKF